MRGFFRATALALAASIVLAAPAPAQEPLLSSIAPNADPVAAVDSAYGRFVVDEVAHLLIANTQASCREARGLDDASVHNKVRDLLVQHAQMWNAFAAHGIDSAAFAQAFDQQAGEGGLREWRRLLEQPLGRQIGSVLAPLRNIDLLDRVANWIYVFSLGTGTELKGWDEALTLGLSGPLSYDQLKAETDKAVQDLAQSPDGEARVKRYRELSEVYAAVLQDVLDIDPASAAAATRIFPGIARRLQALCIAAR